MITCNEALELLSAQLDGAMTIEEQTALQEHLAACPECRRIQSELKMAEEALPKLQQEPPKLLHDAVMQEIRRETRRKKERGRAACHRCHRRKIRQGKRSERRFCALSA